MLRQSSLHCTSLHPEIINHFTSSSSVRPSLRSHGSGDFGSRPKFLAFRRNHQPSDLTQHFSFTITWSGDSFDWHGCFIGVNSFVFWAEGSVTKKLSMT